MENENLGGRVRAVRKALHLTMEEFGGKLGLGKGAISQIENGKNGASEQTIRLICSTFGVSYDWLTTGSGEMFVDDMDYIIDELAARNHWDDQTIDIMKKLYKLPPDKFNLVLGVIDSMQPKDENEEGK